MNEHKPDLKKMVADLVSQIASANHVEKPKADTIKKSLDKLGHWGTKQSIPVYNELTKEEHNKLMMRATLELAATRKKFHAFQSFVLADTHFEDLFTAELEAMQAAINDLESILELDLDVDLNKDKEQYDLFLKKREQLLRRFQ